MGIKKILIVSRSFFPINSPRSFRATELAKEFARQGHQVEVLTLKNDSVHVPFEKLHGLLITDLGKPRWKAVAVKGKGIERLLRRALSRFPNLWFEYPDNELTWKVKNALKNKAGFDLMISIAVPYPIHWGVALARKRNQQIAKTWVADCGDPYMLCKTDSFRKPFYFKYLEKYFSRKADYISIPNIHMKENYYPEFHNKMIEITQGFDFNEVVISNEIPNNPVPTFAFAGNFLAKVRNPKALFDYLCETEIDFKLIVYTNDSTLINPFIERLKNKLEIRSYIPRNELLQELSKMDFLVNIGYDPVHQSPSKLIDYYLAGRPVLSINNNQLDQNTVNEFLAGNYNKQFDFVNMDRFKIENVCKKFINLLD